MCSNQKQLLGILLATLLLFQLAYSTYHVFTSHTNDNHFYENGYQKKNDELGSSCDLCILLLGQTFFINLVTFLVLRYFIFNLLRIGGGQRPITTIDTIYSKRGPPPHY